jgi:hypothetical protein
MSPPKPTMNRTANSSSEGKGLDEAGYQEGARNSGIRSGGCIVRRSLVVTGTSPTFNGYFSLTAPQRTAHWAD